MTGENDWRPEHLSEVPDGCGCVELWEELSAARERAAKADRSEEES